MASKKIHTVILYKTCVHLTELAIETKAKRPYDLRDLSTLILIPMRPVGLCAIHFHPDAHGTTGGPSMKPIFVSSRDANSIDDVCPPTQSITFSSANLLVLLQQLPAQTSPLQKLFPKKRVGSTLIWIGTQIRIGISFFETLPLRNVNLIYAIASFCMALFTTKFTKNKKYIWNTKLKEYDI